MGLFDAGFRRCFRFHRIADRRPPREGVGREGGLFRGGGFVEVLVYVALLESDRRPPRGANGHLGVTFFGDHVDEPRAAGDEIVHLDFIVQLLVLVRLRVVEVYGRQVVAVPLGHLGFDRPVLVKVPHRLVQPVRVDVLRRKPVILQPDPPHVHRVGLHLLPPVQGVLDTEHRLAELEVVGVLVPRDSDDLAVPPETVITEVHIFLVVRCARMVTGGVVQSIVHLVHVELVVFRHPERVLVLRLR